MQHDDHCSVGRPVDRSGGCNDDVTSAAVRSFARRKSEMGTRIYVGNLSTRVTESDLEDEVNPRRSRAPFRELWRFCQFKKFGLVRNIWVARQPPGFAFVVMEDDRDAEDAIHKMDGTLAVASLSVQFALGLHGWKVEFSRKDTQRRPDRGPPGRNGRDVYASAVP